MNTRVPPAGVDRGISPYYEQTLVRRTEKRLFRLPFISFLLMSLFWGTVYYHPITQITFGNLGRLCILGLWGGSLLFAKKRSLLLSLNRVRMNRAEIAALFGWVMVNALHLAFQAGPDAYSQFANALLPFIGYLGAIIHLRNDQQQYRNAVLMILCILGSVSLLLVPMVYNEPYIARYFNEIDYGSSEIQWIGSWGLFAVYAISLPCMLAVALQTKTRYMWLPLFFCGSIMVLILLGTFAASLLLIAIGLSGQLLLFLTRERRLWVRGVVITLILASAFYAYSQYSPIQQFDTTVEKLRSIVTGISSEGLVRGEPTSRGYLTAVSWNTFIDNPLFGVGPVSEAEDNYRLVGKHSGFVDGLAQFGILGYGWYLAFLALSFRRVIKSVFPGKGLIDDARAATLIAFFLAGFINPFLFDAAFLTLFYVLVLAP